MELWTLLVILASVWVLTNFWVLPIVRARWKGADFRSKLARVGSLVVLERVRDLTAVGTVTSFGLLALVWTLSVVADVPAGIAKTIIGAVASMYAVAKACSEGYGTALVILGIAGASLALFVAVRSARRSVSAMWIAKANEVHARLVANPAEVLELAEDAELRPLTDELMRLVNLIAQHEQAASAAPEIEAIRARMSQVLSILAVEAAKKSVDFDAAVAASTTDDASLPRSWWQRVFRVLRSDRFCKDVGLLKRPLSYVVTALFLVSLLGWTAEPLANTLQLTVNNLRVNVLDAEAGRALDEALSQARDARSAEATVPVDAVSNADAVQRATRILARAATRQVVRSRLIDGVAHAERSGLRETEFVRAALAEHHIDARPGADAVSKVRREVAETVAKETTEAVEVGRIERHMESSVRPYAERLQKENPALLRRMTARLEARYSVPMSPLDAQSNLIARMVDGVIGHVDVHPATEAGKQAQKLVGEFGNGAMKTWVETMAKDYVADAIVETSRPGVVAHSRDAFRFESSHHARQFARELRAAEGTHWVRSAAAQEEARIAEAIARRAARQAGEDPGLRAVIAERLGGYDTLFPPTGGAHGTATTGGHGVPSGHSPMPGGASFAHTRATSFRVASRSFRVRGVLLGQDHAAQDVDITDLRWTVQPSVGQAPTRVALDVRVGASWVHVGTYDAAVVNQALRYAADRRVVATTITPGDGKVVRRVTYLHPALTDTPLGCRIVEADRLVDTFTAPSATPVDRSRFGDLVADRREMALWMRTVDLAEKVADIPGACPLERVEQIVQQRKLRPARFSSDLAGALEQFMRSEEGKAPGTTKFLQNAHACATGTSQPIAACLCSRVKTAGLGDRYWFPEDHTSQYREKAAVLGSDLAWMKPSPDRLAHVDFWVHTTFALRRSAPSNGSPQVDEETATVVDFPSAQLGALRTTIGEMLPTYAGLALRSPSYDEFARPLEDFIVLQRFVRAALAGSLGRDFPATKLIALERETRKLVPFQPTIRWEGVSTEASFLEELAATDSKAAQHYVAWKDDRERRQRTRAPVCDRVSR